MNLYFKGFRRLAMFTMTLALFICLFTMESYAGSLEFSEIVSPQYDSVMRFSEDLLAVKKDGKWGYIDKIGDIIIDFNYHIAYPFSEGKALVAIEKLEKFEWNDAEIGILYWGIIDKNGNFTNLKRSDGEFISDFPHDFSDDWFYLAHGLESKRYTGYHNGVLVTDILNSPVNWAFDSEGVEIPFGYGAYPLNEGILPTIEGFKDYSTGEILFQDKKIYGKAPFNQGLAPAGLENESGDIVWKFINRNGEILKDISFISYKVRDQFREHIIFNENSLASIQNTEGKWGVINKTGETIIPFKYDELKIFTEGLIGFKSNGKYGFMDINENVRIKPIYDDVSSFNNGLAVVRIEDRAYLIDKEGEKIESSDVLSESAYFKKGYNGDGSISYIISVPSEYVIIEKDSKYGFGRMYFTDRDEDSTQ